MKSLLKKLVSANSPSGFEGNVRDVIIEEIKNYVDEYHVDTLGNLIARKGLKGTNGKRVMLSAHMDEIGIIVTHVDEKGFARFTNLGYVLPRNALGGRVRFLNGSTGVVWMEPGENIRTLPPLNKLYIDLGVDSQKDCPVEIGDVGAFERVFEDMGDRVVSKALDDRIGVAVLIEIIKKLKASPNEINAVFTTQEEVRLVGAIGAAYNINPDMGIAIDVTDTGDTPNAKRMDVSLGNGPAIKIKDGGMISDPKIVNWMVAGAKTAKIPYQKEILLGGTTDAMAIQLARSGVPVGAVSIPGRYIHSPSEMVDINDAKNSVKLLVALLSKTIKLK
ncbi:MAG: M20/M25/M40 family metallo-hydrolase [Chloroflexota bacterium]